MRVIDLGRDVPYEDGMGAMRSAMEHVDSAESAESAESVESAESSSNGSTLLLLEHTPVITTTRSGGTAFVTTSREALAADGIALVETDRGGDVTFHGPGQLVGYPVLRIAPADERARIELVGYVRALESALVRACQRLGVGDAHGADHARGVWCDAPVVDEETLGCNFAQVSRQECKLVAIGVGVSHGVTRHGFALNVTTPIERYTKHIVPCGLVGKGVTSLERVLMRVPSMDEIKRVVAEEVTAGLDHFASTTSVHARTSASSRTESRTS